MPADGRIVVSGGAEGEELDPLVIAPGPKHAGVRPFDSAVLTQALDVLEAGQGGDDQRRAEPACLRPYLKSGSPNQGSTWWSKRVMAQIRSPVRVRTNRPVPRRMPVGVRR